MRIWPLFVILLMHILFFFALTHGSVGHAGKDERANAVSLLIPVTPSINPALQKNEYEKEAPQKSLTTDKKEAMHALKAARAPVSTEKPPLPVPATKSISDITANATTNPATDTAAPSTVDLGQLRSQAALLARDAAKSETSETGYTSIFGDYYGSYSGTDTGTFYIHVDRIGNIFGSADSSTAHSSFTITGKVSTDGVVQMMGKGLAGSASFDGKINLKTGAVSGRWNLTGFGRGQFAGQRAKDIGGKGN